MCEWASYSNNVTYLFEMTGGIRFSYDPPMANAYRLLDNLVAYNEFVNKICDCIVININENKITLLWKRTIYLGNGFIYGHLTLQSTYEGYVCICYSNMSK